MIKHQNIRLFGTSHFLIKQRGNYNLINNNKFCTQITEKQLPDAEIELKNSRSYDEVPKFGVVNMIRHYSPGGKFYKKDTNEVMKIIATDYGNILRIPSLFGRPEMVIVHDPNDFERVFRNEGIWPSRPGSETLGYHRSTHQADFYNGVEGLISTHGEKWGKFRTIVNPVLMQPKNVRIYLQKMAEVSNDFVQRIRKIRNPKTNEMPENFEDEINRWTLESVAVVALDKRFGLLRSDTIDAKVQQYFNNISEFFHLSGELDTKPSLWKIIPTPNFKRLMHVLDEIQNTTSHFVNEAIQRLENEQKQGIDKPENEKSVLEKLLKIDRSVATVMAMDMLIAGIDTTTTTFSGALLCLAKNPEKQAKLREEIRRILPNKDSNFTERSLSDMSYLRGCIKEALRIYPLAEGNGRVVQRDVVLSGYRVPKGTYVITSTSTLNCDEKYFPRANEFLPERWLRTSKEENSKECPNALKLSNPFVYLPFGFGPRSCIGRRIAEMELELGIARIIRNFNVAFNYPTENAFKTVLINTPNIPLKFQLTDVLE